MSQRTAANTNKTVKTSSRSTVSSFSSLSSYSVDMRSKTTTSRYKRKPGQFADVNNDASYDADDTDDDQTVVAHPTSTLEWRKIKSVPDTDQNGESAATSASFPSIGACAYCGDGKETLKLLPCMHSFCVQCLASQIVQSASRPWIKCRMCKKRIGIPSKGVDGFEENKYFQFSELSISENDRCDTCQDRTPKCRCSECKLNFCTECVKEHLANETEKSHYVVNVTPEMLGKAPWNAICKEHSPFTLELYCLVCSKPICGRCAIDKHNNHIAEDIQVTAREKRNDLKSLMSDASTQRLIRGIDNHAKINLKERAHLQAEIDSAVDAIQSHIQTLKQELDDFGRKLITEVKEREKTLLSVSDKTIEDLETKQRSTHLSLETIRQIIDRTRDIEFINKYPILKECFSEIKKTSKLSPSQCVRMKYIPLVQTLKSSIGRIAVESFLKKPIHYLEICSIHLPKYISSICPVNESKAWIGFRKYIQLCSKDGTFGLRIDVGDQVVSISENSNGTIFVACKTCMKVITSKLVPKLIFPLSQEPSDIKFNEMDNLIICFKDARRIALFTTKGNLLKEFDIRHLGYRFGSRINDPWKLAVSENQDIYLSDFSSDSVAVYDKECELKSAFSCNVYRHATLSCDRGLLFIADYNKDCVRLFSENGQCLQVCQIEGINAPCAIAVDKTGDLWLGSWSGSVKVYAPR